jgi:hypothetical protein
MKNALTDSTDRVPQVINLVAPFCWVSPEAAIRVAALAARAPGQLKAIAWRRSWTLSERMHLYRAYCTRSKSKLKVVDISDRAGGVGASIEDHIRSSLAQDVCHNRLASESAIRAKSRELAARGIPVFLVLPVDAVDAVIVNDVCTKWPDVCVILFGESLDQEQVRQHFPGIDFVEPALVREDEENAQTGWGECMDVAGVSYENLESGAAFLR